MWNNIKEEITKTIQDHVPTKRTLARQTHPWVDGNIKKATRRKLRAFNKAKRTSNPADWKRYRNIKAQTQRELRSAYRKYMNDVISTDLKENPKRFWAAIKSKGIYRSGTVEKQGRLYTQ